MINLGNQQTKGQQKGACPTEGRDQTRKTMYNFKGFQKVKWGVVIPRDPWDEKTHPGHNSTTKRSRHIPGGIGKLGGLTRTPRPWGRGGGVGG